MSRVRAILFDVDGVLVKPSSFAGVLEREYGLSQDDMAGFFNGPFIHCLRGDADLTDELPPFLDDWGWPHSIDEFVAQWFETDSATNPEMIAFAGEMRRSGLACYVASTQERRRAAYIEHDMGFAHLFDALFFSCRLGHIKPEPEYYERIAAGLRLLPSEMLFLDDRSENVAGARDAGWRAEVYNLEADLREIAGRHGIAWNWNRE